MMKKIGWIGTGVMGVSMCGHLLAKGHHATVFSRTKAKAQPLLDRGNGQRAEHADPDQGEDAGDAEQEGHRQLDPPWRHHAQQLDAGGGPAHALGLPCPRTVVLEAASC